MKFLCLAYGDEAAWKSLSETEQQELLANDEVILRRGDLVSAVRPAVISVRNRDKNLEITTHDYVAGELTLAGFSVIEAENVEEVIRLVANTPCARANGVIDIRPFRER